MTLDSVATVYRPIMYSMPISVLYFICYILIMPIALMNLVTAITVQSAIQLEDETAQFVKDFEQAEKRRIVQELRLMFTHLDQDNNAVITLDEIEDAPEAIQS